jgi:hypothetical protein
MEERYRGRISELEAKIQAERREREEFTETMKREYVEFFKNR